MEILDNVYLDENGYKAHLVRVNELKKELYDVTSQISKIILEGRKEDVTSDYERLIIVKKHLKEVIETKERETYRIVIVSRDENSNLLDIMDVVKVRLNFPNGIEEEYVFELTAGDNDFTGEIEKVSINEPLGKSIYRKNVGDVGFYDIKEGTVQVSILEKVKTKKYSLDNK